MCSGTASSRRLLRQAQSPLFFFSEVSTGNSQMCTGKCMRYTALFSLLWLPHPGLIGIRSEMGAYLRTDLRETYQIEPTPCCSFCAESCFRSCMASMQRCGRKIFCGACDNCRPSIHITAKGRERYTEAGDCHDVWTHFWCGPCALCQEIRCSFSRFHFFLLRF